MIGKYPPSNVPVPASWIPRGYVTKMLSQKNQWWADSYGEAFNAIDSRPGPTTAFPLAQRMVELFGKL